MPNLKSLLSLFRHLKITTFQKGDVLIKEGETKKELFYIRKGMVRSYFINGKTEEVTFQLFSENFICGNIHSILFDEPSQFCFQAIEKTKLYAIDYDSFVKLSIRNQNVAEINIGFLGKRILKQAFQRVESFVSLSAEDRYLKYAEDHPNIVNRAPDKYIANVLGVTPVTLSRIRNRISFKEIHPYES